MTMKSNRNLNQNLIHAIEAGDVMLVLSLLSGQDEQELERELAAGKTPWQLARELGVLEPFYRVVMERMQDQLNFMVRTEQMSKRQAEGLALCFAKNMGQVLGS